jgi:hypothetical protein
MPLLNFWKNNREDVLKLTIEQIVANSGDGNLRDGSESSRELREFLTFIPSEFLFGYARHCLENSFTHGGYVLQDIVNELGQRLDFKVEHGLYQGKRGAIGFDGIWRSQSEPDLIIEVKTTDTYTTALEILADYKEKLSSAGRVQRNASVLVVVGRDDTNALEAQVRGSRYAWEMRLISVERLNRLVQIKEKSDDPETLNQIRQLLQPFEYTKIDKIIDVVFTTASDVESQQTAENETSIDGREEDGSGQIRTDLDLLNAKRQEAIDAFSDLKGTELVRRSRTLFWSPDKEFRVSCVVSKRYEGDYQAYWYAFHPKWDKFLADGKNSYYILSCMDREEAFAVPYSWIVQNKGNLSVTDRGERSYWQIPVTTFEGGKLAINLSKIGMKTPLEPYKFLLKPSRP